jgi:hypothetical protein
VSALDQHKVATWANEVLGDSATDVPERALRFVEEALELAQAVGVDVETAHKLVDYVFGRPAGEPAQEIAGSMVTLYAAASALGIDADEAFYAELSRIQRPVVIERVRRRQHEKRAALK